MNARGVDSDFTAAARGAFERWYSGYGAYPKSIERDSNGSYRLAQAHSAWITWAAAWEAGTIALAESTSDLVRALDEYDAARRAWDDAVTMGERPSKDVAARFEVAIADSPGKGPCDEGGARRGGFAMTHEPRSRTLARHIDAALRATGLPFNALADRAVDLYHARTALHERMLQFQAGTTVATHEQAQRLNAQQVRRMLDGIVRFPADFEEALVLALPEAHRDACLRDLAARYGLLAAELPEADGAAQQTSVAGFLLDTGELISELAPAFADGVLNDADAPIARRALPRVLDLQARLATIAKTLDAAVRAPRMRIAS